NAFRIFTVGEGGELTLKGITLKDGNAAREKKKDQEPWPTPPKPTTPPKTDTPPAAAKPDPAADGVAKAGAAVAPVAAAPAAKAGAAVAPVAAAPAAEAGSTAAPVAGTAPAVPATGTAQGTPETPVLPETPAAPGMPVMPGGEPGDGSSGTYDEGADGGAILVKPGGSAFLEDSNLFNNNASGNGGAIANFGRT
ncbi:hypothetical protein GVV04_31960, partial [Micromonospora sp. NEAU-HG-1]|nr:hypothetical protein [Micromonospora rubida]